MDYNALFESGCLVDLNIHEWRPMAKLTPKEIGIPDTDSVRRALSLPSVRMLDKDHIAPIVRTGTELRRALEHMSIDFPIRGMRFVPYHKYEEMENRLFEIKAKRFAAVDDFLKVYAEAREEGLATVKNAIMDATKNDIYITDQVLSELQDRFPDPSEMHELFRVSWTPVALASPNVGNVTAHVGQCVKDMLQNLRDQLDESAVNIGKLVQSGGKLHGRSAATARALCTRLRSLNVLGDEALDHAIAWYEGLITQAETGGPNIANELEDMRQALAETTEEAIAAAKEALTKPKRKVVL